MEMPVSNAAYSCMLVIIFNKLGWSMSIALPVWIFLFTLTIVGGSYLGLVKDETGLWIIDPS
jgi:general stress protein CsbA